MVRLGDKTHFAWRNSVVFGQSVPRVRYRLVPLCGAVSIVCFGAHHFFVAKSTQGPAAIGINHVQYCIQNCTPVKRMDMIS